jgi:hypothetical protein
MADKKISALTSASTPLAGTEVLPIVQSGSTVKVAVSNLTAGRAVSASSLTASTSSVNAPLSNMLAGTTNDYSIGVTGYYFAKNGFVWANDNTGSASNRNWVAGVNEYAAGAWQLTSSNANNTWPNDAYRFAVTIAGSCYNTTGTYGTLSDERFKENISDARGYADDLMKVRVVKYSLKEEESDVATKLGVIAQEIEQIFPNLIDVGSTPQGEEFKSVKMTVFLPMLIKAFQELKSEVDALKRNA